MRGDLLYLGALVGFGRILRFAAPIFHGKIRGLPGRDVLSRRLFMYNGPDNVFILAI
jgi:hypothetical protein